MGKWHFNKNVAQHGDYSTTWQTDEGNARMLSC